jgi:hypothetical protein
MSKEPTESERLLAEIGRLRLISAAAEKLVLAIGERGVCSSPACREEIWWIIHRNGRRAPYNRDGVTHFATCPAAAQFRKDG